MLDRRTFSFGGPRTPPLSPEGVADLRLLLDYLAVRDAPRPADVVFCFGSRDLTVPATAARLYAAGAAPWVLVTGGARGRTTHPTESEAFGAVLAAHGVPAERIILERHASNTGENVALGMRALAERGVEVGSAALVGWPISMRRCRATFRHWFCDVVTSACPTDHTFHAPGPGVVDAALAELQRLRLYPALGYMAEEEIPPDVRDAESRLTAGTAGSIGAALDYAEAAAA